MDIHIVNIITLVQQTLWVPVIMLQHGLHQVPLGIQRGPHVHL